MTDYELMGAALEEAARAAALGEVPVGTIPKTRHRIKTTA